MGVCFTRWRKTVNCRRQSRKSRHGVPVAGVALSILILLVGSCLNYIIPNPQRVFVYVYSASVLPGMVPWFVILISQLRFRRAHKEAIADHPFRSIMFPWANYLTMAFLVCVLIGMYFNEDTRMSLFVGVIFLLAVTLVYKVFGLNRHGTAHKVGNKRQNAQSITKRAFYLKRHWTAGCEVRIIHPRNGAKRP